MYHRHPHSIYNTEKQELKQAWGDFLGELANWDWFATLTFRDPGPGNGNWTKPGWAYAKSAFKGFVAAVQPVLGAAEYVIKGCSRCKKSVECHTSTLFCSLPSCHAVMKPGRGDGNSTVLLGYCPMITGWVLGIISASTSPKI